VFDYNKGTLKLHMYCIKINRMILVYKHMLKCYVSRVTDAA